MVQQSKECSEQHKVLKAGFEELKKNCSKMQTFFFGSVDNKDELSFVDKVNIMYTMMNENRNTYKTFIATSALVLVGWIFALGYQFSEIKKAISTIEECKTDIQAIKQDNQDVNKRLIILETKTGVK